jgi:hypothetical protein
MNEPRQACSLTEASHDHRRKLRLGIERIEPLGQLFLDRLTGAQHEGIAMTCVIESVGCRMRQC